MRRFLPIALVSVACCLTGCMSGDLKKVAQTLPVNSFDRIELGLAIGPFTHTTILAGGDKSGDTLRIKSVTGQTTFMNWGSHLEIVNAEVTLPAPPVPPPVLGSLAKAP